MGWWNSVWQCRRLVLFLSWSGYIPKLANGGAWLGSEWVTPSPHGLFLLLVTGRWWNGCSLFYWVQVLQGLFNIDMGTTCCLMLKKTKMANCSVVADCDDHQNSCCSSRMGRCAPHLLVSRDAPLKFNFKYLPSSATSIHAFILCVNLISPKYSFKETSWVESL